MKTDGRHFWFWLAALAAMLAGLALFKDILLPFVLGMMFAFFLNPVADWLQTRGLSRTMAAVVIVGVAGTALVLAMITFAPMLALQVQQLALSLPADLERARVAIEKLADERLGSHAVLLQNAIDRAIVQLQSNAASLVSLIAAAVWNRGAALLNLVSVLLITPLVVFYLLVDWHPMLARVNHYLPRDHVGTIQHLAHEIHAAVAAFVRGQGVVCLCLGLFYAASLSLLGLNYGAAIGLATGVLAFVPMVGWVAGTALAVGTALVQFAPKLTPVLGVAGVMAAGMALDTVALSPRLVGQKVGLHPVWLIFALFAFSYLFGIVGTLVAVPVSAAIAVLTRFGLGRYLESEVYRGRGPAAALTSAPVATLAPPEARP